MENDGKEISAKAVFYGTILLILLILLMKLFSVVWTIFQNQHLWPGETISHQPISINQFPLTIL